MKCSYENKNPAVRVAASLSKVGLQFSWGIKHHLQLLNMFLCSARWNWWRHPDEGDGVEERGGHVGHQSQLPKEVRSVSLHHYPGTAHPNTKPLSAVCGSVCLTVCFWVTCNKYSDPSEDRRNVILITVSLPMLVIPLHAAKHQLGVLWLRCLHTIHVSTLMECRLLIYFKCLVQRDETASLLFTLAEVT